MIAGEVISLPRGGRCVCGGCRRVLPVAASVALDLAGGGWVYVCYRCYAADPPGSWRGLGLLWTGEGWIPATAKEGLVRACGGSIPLPNESEARSGD